ncbi:MAG: mannose-1-phosphate guanylyltransferase [Salegentibacter sp.]
MSEVLHVLLTGGVGSRLWPLSRRSRPKQYLDIFSGKSLFELAVRRNRPFAAKLLIVGNEASGALSGDILKKMGISDFQTILEATPRNTAPAIAFAAFSAKPETILLVTPSDHLIAEGEEYKKAVESAIQFASQDHLVTFGILPTRPETGYGYIEFSESDVLSFREKPDSETAEAFIEKGNFLWNSGLFCFKASVFLEELKKFSPEVFYKSLEAWEKAEAGRLEYSSSMEIPSISIDYAVLERSALLKVVPAEFEWSDMGSFEAVYDYLRQKGHQLDENENMQIGELKPTFFLGLRNCILISTRDANLVLSKEFSQDVRNIYKELEKNNPDLVN